MVGAPAPPQPQEPLREAHDRDGGERQHERLGRPRRREAGRVHNASNPTSPVHASHVRGQSPSVSATATSSRDTSGTVPKTCRAETCPGTVPHRPRTDTTLRDMSGDCPHELPAPRDVPRAEPQRPRPSETRLGTVPTTCLGTACPKGWSTGLLRRITATSEEAGGSLLHQPSKGDR